MEGQNAYLGESKIRCNFVIPGWKERKVMDSGIYTMDSRIRYSEVDSERKLTMAALVNYMQDCCTFQSEELGIGVDYLSEHGVAWFLSSWQIELVRQLSFCDKIRISTWPYDFKGFYGYRNFTLEDELGNVCAYANSVWVFMDVVSGRPVKIFPKLTEVYQLNERYPMTYGERKLRLPDGMEPQERFAVQQEHIDTNHHVNNECYVAMAGRFLPENAVVKRLRAEYRKAAVLGDWIYPFVCRDNTHTVVSLADEQGRAYAAVEFGF